MNPDYRAVMVAAREWLGPQLAGAVSEAVHRGEDTDRAPNGQIRALRDLLEFVQARIR